MGRIRPRRPWPGGVCTGDEIAVRPCPAAATTAVCACQPDFHSQAQHNSRWVRRAYAFHLEGSTSCCKRSVIDARQESGDSLQAWEVRLAPSLRLLPDACCEVLGEAGVSPRRLEDSAGWDAEEGDGERSSGAIDSRGRVKLVATVECVAHKGGLRAHLSLTGSSDAAHNLRGIERATRSVQKCKTGEGQGGCKMGVCMQIMNLLDCRC